MSFFWAFHGEWGWKTRDACKLPAISAPRHQVASCKGHFVCHKTTTKISSSLRSPTEANHPGEAFDLEGTLLQFEVHEWLNQAEDFIGEPDAEDGQKHCQWAHPN
jgi:hypothetical protein